MFELLILFFIFYIHYLLVDISYAILKDDFVLLEHTGSKTFLITDTLLLAAIWSVIAAADIALVLKILG